MRALAVLTVVAGAALVGYLVRRAGERLEEELSAFEAAEWAQ